MAKKIELIKNNLDNGYHYYGEGGQRHDIQTVKHTLDNDVTMYKDGRKYNVHVSKSPLDGSRKIRVDERPGLFDNYRGLFSVNTDDSGSGNSDTSYGNSSASSYSGSTQGTVGPYGGSYRRLCRHIIYRPFGPTQSVPPIIPKSGYSPSSGWFPSCFRVLPALLKPWCRS